MDLDLILSGLFDNSEKGLVIARARTTHLKLDVESAGNFSFTTFEDGDSLNGIICGGDG